jgi:transcriptional regulator with XRE-family HTH domain
MLGLSQTSLGDALGLSFQQVQKYERGANRIGASRLLEMARVLDVPVAFFFDHADPDQAPVMPRAFDDASPLGGDPFQQAEIIELVTAYYNLPSVKIRRIFFALARALAETGSDASLAAIGTEQPGGREPRAGSHTPSFRLPPD